MNSLEFIEKIIKNIETALTEDKRVYQLYLLKNNIDKNKILKNLDENIKHREESLQTFQQIKVELEAWEVIKKHFEYHEGDVFNCFKEGFVQTTKLNSKDFEIIKKAVEVNNNE